ncbi:MAG: hypothetical protein A3C02_04715 [Candidatus Andersenbacteria bacterium RIFCSPHIGHO2_02_FULL_45_11]|uniref:Peptidase M10 metallopeptidase domain-containing protein n=1 Tax=Candidatus Andersenbacteria bacterium RIFCSPHIGHO2_12_FULL_45_11 TaxID=1797281 RepID=A0A1G1X277_9BACT|nr:MAG: hypothetical protein A2805_00305 [Candidatus Andersenbacteria bacterium RIFCSPHIGHO2_01_FULL_46_36]OGY34116.1 MAG: hypothetical protein A3D99_01825 [Candidatus Andersenbacteria bacterium RIFCSPHIGHO2_12_FULL_45_11]OGY34240.1 MAG: hypothetical protein A3C02_04715 [Candidatus Andersenbacteria bacterium RIFCSPHIGHO2_02_FULL_45_11]
MHAFLRGLISASIIAAIFAGAVIVLFPAPCAKPITYSIGDLDPRFKLPKETFLKDIALAERKWEEQIGKELFVYDPASKFTINLTYDERQATTDKAKAITQSLEKTSESREGLLQKYEDARNVYDVALRLYDKHSAQLNTDSVVFSATVERYNKEGGAPSEEYAKLQAEQARLAERSATLEAERIQLNGLASTVNKFADTEGKIVNTYNETVEKFNDEFSGDREFDQGEYTGNAITIYEFVKNNDLVVVLTHELGHALGIGHVQDPRAVMHYKVNEKNIQAKSLAADDISALMSQCKKGSWDVFYERLMNFTVRDILNTLFHL